VIIFESLSTDEEASCTAKVQGGCVLTICKSAYVVSAISLLVKQVNLRGKCS